MMKPVFKNILKSAAALSLVAVLSVSCGDEKSTTSRRRLAADDVISIEPVDCAEEAEPMSNSWSGDEGVVCVVFGYGFNEKFCEDAKKRLDEIYGLSENGGLVQAVVFPGDLRGRISNLKEIVDSKNVRALVILGAPEKTHAVFARIQDDWDEVVPFNIISLFPQDDVLGQESTCNLVFDMQTEDGITFGDEEQNAGEEVLDLLVSAVKYAALSPAAFANDKDLAGHAQNIMGKKKIHPYVDGETGIKSTNHFVIERGAN